MPEWKTLSPDGCGEALRRTIAARLRRSRRRRIALAVAAVLMPLLATLAWPPGPALVWNVSASAPRGLYRIHSTVRVEPGDMVLARLPAAIRRLAAERHYLPANVPLLKRVAATAGDEVCARAGEIAINGRPAAARKAVDGKGRPLPWWRGCRRLGTDDIFLLSDSPWSFDGRYFGVSRRASLIRRAELLWPR